jgi:hypothetical protein
MGLSFKRGKMKLDSGFMDEFGWILMFSLLAPPLSFKIGKNLKSKPNTVNSVFSH